jgi:hypothetical protein
VQATWHVAPPPHEMLPLWPSVTVQVDWPVQLILQEGPQLPLQTV